MITPEDVRQVAKDLDFELTDDQVNQIIKDYPAAQEEDPHANWDLIVENMIYHWL